MKVSFNLRAKEIRDAVVEAIPLIPPTTMAFNVYEVTDNGSLRIIHGQIHIEITYEEDV